MLGRLLLSSKFCIDEIINIVRPVVYLWSILKFGRKSFKPLKISFALDLVQIFFSLLRIWRSNKEKKKLIDADKTLHKRPSQRPLLHRVGPLSQEHPELEISQAKLPKHKAHYVLRNIEISKIIERIYMALLKYLIRGPIYNTYTQPGL